jgi:hypothetical protein
MGYFSNLSEGAAYEAQWCSRCQHHGDCDIWDKQVIYNYNPEWRDRLNALIPESPDGLGNEQCTGFEFRAAGGE